MSRVSLARLATAGCIAAALGLTDRVAAADSGDPAGVVGGAPAPAGRWPDVAAITDGQFAFCTGTLVAPEVVITAAHCVEDQVGAVKLDATDSEAPGGEVIQVADATAYPDWESTYDIAVLVLSEPSLVTPRSVATECIVDESLVDAAPVTLVGYGATTEQGDDFNTRLMQGEATILDAGCVRGDGCAEQISPGGEFTAGGLGVDSCFGDSGGPVYLATRHGTVLAGVVSRGVESSPTPCGGGGIYVRPDGLLDWIEETAGRPISRAICRTNPDPGEGDDGGDDDGGADDGGDDSGADPGPDDEEPVDDDGGAGLPPPPGLISGGCSAEDGRGGTWPALALLALALLLRRKLTAR